MKMMKFNPESEIPSMTPTYVLDEKYEKGRINLQPWQDDKAEQLLAYRLENRSFLEPFEALHDDDYFTLTPIRHTIGKWTLEAAKDTGYAFGIFLKEDDTLIGSIRLSGIMRGPFCNALLGYSMAQKCNGQGLMTEAVGLCLSIAFGVLDLHRVEAGVMPHNTGSIRVLEKNGFERIGYSRRHVRINGNWEDHALLAILSEDWSAT
jgi:ribosomal-protein-alanine N-acetyltransferase